LTDETMTHIRALNDLARRRGQSLAQLAVAWVLRDPRMTSTVVGASSVAQLEDTLSALGNLDFSSDALAEIDRHATDAGINLWPRWSTAEGAPPRTDAGGPCRRARAARPTPGRPPARSRRSTGRPASGQPRGARGRRLRRSRRAGRSPPSRR